MIGRRIKINDGVWSIDGEKLLAGKTGIVEQFIPSQKHGRLYFAYLDDEKYEDNSLPITLYPDEFTFINGGE